ncbi:MAG TPA: MBL fold metallo-hydrolase, partial [Ilumatobacteraceae bacterium]|nr:MBL fold metallo-hydrolase [Ilumatobacteraceae bacterium]
MTDQAARPRKQEQEPASEAIVELAPNVLRCQLPIDMPGLGHVNCYLLEDDRGVAVVDPGLPSKASFASLTSRLAAAGYPLSRVHTVIVTHSHPDHFGGAGWLQRESGADVVTHRSFRFMWDPAEPPDVDVEDVPDLAGDADGEPLPHTRRFPWQKTPWGGPGVEIPLKRKAWFVMARAMPMMRRLPQPTVRLEEAQTIALARRDWIAVHTPGHTHDHLCLFDPTDGCMLCGDHVLPTITP